MTHFLFVFPSSQRSIRSFANDDCHVMAKHADIYPLPEELEAVQKLVSTVECALKQVSDWMDNLNASLSKAPTTTTTVDIKAAGDSTGTHGSTK